MTHRRWPPWKASLGIGERDAWLLLCVCVFDCSELVLEKRKKCRIGSGGHRINEECRAKMTALLSRESKA